MRVSFALLESSRRVLRQKALNRMVDLPLNLGAHAFHDQEAGSARLVLQPHAVT